MSKDDLSKGLDQAAAQAGTVKHKGRGLGALRPSKAKGETKIASYRLGEELIARIDSAALAQGIDSSKKAAFVGVLLTYALDALERGELTIPKRETPDL